MKPCLQAEHREPSNRTGLKRLRKEGRLPGIIFGVNTENAMIHISRKEFQQWMKGGGADVVEISLGANETIPVILENIQRDVVTKELIHADFLRVKQNQMVRIKLPIAYIGTAKGTKLGGIIQTYSSFVDVEALPVHLPPSITVDISSLDRNETIQAGDIELPEGVTLVSPANELLVSFIRARGNVE